jgi:hypothetical protein
MAQQRGSNVKIIYDTETVFRTTPGAPASMVLPFVRESLRMSRNLVSSNTIRSSRNPQQPVRGNVDVAGSIDIELAPQYGLLFKHIFGTVATTGSGPYTHTHKIGDLPAGMTIEKQFLDLSPIQYFKYNGCKVNNFKCTIKPEGLITASVDIIGATETVSSGGSFHASPTDRGITPFDGFGCTIKQGGSTLAIGTEVSFTIANGLDASMYVIDGTGYRYSLPEGLARVTGNLKCIFDAITMYNLAVAGTESSLEVTLTKGTGAGTAGNEKMVFLFDELIFKPAAPVVEGPTGLLVDLDFEAYYGDDADISALRVQTFDSWATY